MLVGAYYGQDIMEKPLYEHVPVSIAPHVPTNLKVLQVLATFFAFLECLFALEHVFKCLGHDPLRSLWFFAAPLITFIPALISGYLQLESYRNHFVVFHFLISWTLNTQQYRLFLANMTKRFPFNPFGIEHIFCMIPVFVHLFTPDSELRDTLVVYSTYACAACVFLLFYGHIYLLSMQWLAY